MNWKQVLAGVAPALATALGGPLAGAAVATLGRTLLGDDKASEESISEAVMSLAPSELALKLKEADHAFRLEIAKLRIRALEIDQQDRANARSREIATGDVWTPRVIACVVFLVWAAVNYALFTTPVEANRDLIMRALGILDAAILAVLYYYFGSSAGSKAKDDVMAGSVRR